MSTNRNDRAFNVTQGNTRYTRGGVSDVYNTRVGWWERNVLAEDTTDLFFDVSNRTEGRPDLIAYEVYGSTTYMWVVLQFNNIIDINEELISGAVIKLPTPTRLNTVLLANSAGGKRVSG